MQDLGTEQRARIERLARGKGITCRTCGSAELRSDGRAHPYVGKGFGVDLWCTNADAHLQTIPAWEQYNPSSYPRKRRVRQVLSLQAEDDTCPDTEGPQTGTQRRLWWRRIEGKR